MIEDFTRTEIELHNLRKMLRASGYFSEGSVFTCLITNRCVVVPLIVDSSKEVTIIKSKGSLSLLFRDGQEACIKRGRNVATVYMDGWPDKFLNYLKEEW